MSDDWTPFVSRPAGPPNVVGRQRPDRPIAGADARMAERTRLQNAERQASRPIRKFRSRLGPPVVVPPATVVLNDSCASMTLVSLRAASGKTAPSTRLERGSFAAPIRRHLIWQMPIGRHQTRTNAE